MLRFSIRLAIFISLLPIAPAAAEEIDTYTLGQLLEVASHQDPDLALARVDVAVANAAILQAAGLDDWLLDATARYSSTYGEQFGLTSKSSGYNAEANLSRSFFTGGTVTLHADAQHTSSTFFQNVSMDGMPDMFQEVQTRRYANAATIILNQPLLEGRGRRVARAAQARSDLSRSVQLLALEAAAVSSVRDVIRGFWELVYAWQDVEIRRGSLTLAEERLRITRAGIEGGAVAPTEALAVEQAIAARQEEILAAELAITERSIELRRMVGLEIGPGDLEMRPAAELLAETQELDLNALLPEAFRQSPEIAVLSKREEGAELEVAVTQNGLLPALDFTGFVGPFGFDTQSASNALSNLFTFNDYTFSVGLRFEHNLGNRAARGAVGLQRAELTRVRINLADARMQIAATLALAVKQANAAALRMQLSQRAIDITQRNIEAEQARFELGRATNFDVLQRQEELKQAQLRYARAVVDYLSAVAVVDAITGGILPKYGITVLPEEARQ